MKTRCSLVVLSLTVLTVLAATSGCSNTDSSTLTGPVGSGLAVGQGGAQDFAYFRSIVEAGGVPRPRTLDPVGFFAEHAVDLPPPTCGEAVCVHASLAVAPRFDGGNWTMGFIGMNTPFHPEALPRPPVHVVLAIETSEATAALREGLVEASQRMFASLRPADAVSVVRIGTTAQRIVGPVSPSARSLASAVESLSSATDEGIALYDGLALAGQAALERPAPDALAHVVLVSSGAANRGVTSHERIVRLAESLAEEGVSIALVGGGRDFDDRIPLAIGEIGSGTYSYVRDADELANVFELEGRTRLLPIATDLRITVEPAPGYRIGQTYGARRMVATDEAAHLASPVLFIGQREGASDVDRGRRGGGGGLFVELIADPLSGLGRGRPAFTVRTSYVDARGREVRFETTVTNPLAPAENPTRAMATLTDPTPSRAKAYMMLNMYLGLRGATEFFEAGDCPRALGVIDMMGRSVELWQASEFADPDTEADWMLMRALRANIAGQCQAIFGPVRPIEPLSFRGGCMVS